PDFLTAYQVELTVGGLPATSAATVEVKGLLRDEATRDPIVGASIRVVEETNGASTNALGRFTITLAPGAHELAVDYIGYRSTAVKLQVNQAGEIEIPLQANTLELATVEIQGNKSANKQTAVATGVEMLSAQKIKELPSFMGESDVLKSLLVLPGVSTVGEGSSGFNVRGGNIDQNLVIQDELPFFNTSHVLGFFSVFNPDLVRSTTLYKGHIPARLGGKVASALEVKLREGDFQKWHGSAGAGLAAGKLTLEGPIWKDKISIIVGGRASYSDWMLKRIKLPDVQNSSAWFNDLNAKIAMRVNKNGTVNLGLHRSEDYFRFADQFGYKWQTLGGNIAWRQSWNGGIVTSLTASSGRLNNTFFQPAGFDAFELKNGLSYSTVNLNASLLSIEGQEIMGGLQWSRNNTLPQVLAPRGTDSGIASESVKLENGEEYAAFLSDEFKLSSRLSLDLGLRYSYFRTLGPGQVFTYEPNTPYAPETIMDTTVIGANQASQTYGGPEPRISLNFKLNSRQNIKLSYNRLRQYLHLISNTTAATPADIWQPSNRYIQPQISDSYSGGWFYTPENHRWEGSVEVFFRNTAHV
ncbi:MAG: TonB-dependent receptor, partial [Saprospiraceae bacterium]